VERRRVTAHVVYSTLHRKLSYYLIAHRHRVCRFSTLEMHSPMDPESASSSDTESPPPEDSLKALDSSDLIPSMMSTGSPFKRRGQGGSSSREMKSRRREDSGRRPLGPWDMRDAGPMRPKDDLVDPHVVEQLRAQFGDPFDDRTVKGLD